MKNIIALIDRVLSGLCVFLSSMLVICVVWQVFSRYVLSVPSTSTGEMARFLFIWVGLIGAAYTLGQKRHLAIDLLSSKLEHKPVLHSQLAIFITLISVFFASVIMIYGGANLMLKTLSTGQLSPVLGIPMGYIYAAIPLSGVCMLIYLIDNFIDNLAALTSAIQQEKKL
ncbi:TRAP transporter small permease [Marinomonas sp. 2405UD68-3]|uniref:TRAP transporter small permease n=1 Tax=Marinomonas sp. 2405UD68-3 TaxID=3391835 RepID=UPI0039C92466